MKNQDSEQDAIGGFFDIELSIIEALTHNSPFGISSVASEYSVIRYNLPW